MGPAAGYNFSTDYLRRQIYAPQLYRDVEQEQRQLRQGLLKLLTDQGLRVRIEPQQQQQQ